ncbi:MAG: hypothetical protein C0404_07085 [Verrucomicrobia bacterium]|nr:hypothetical protein [Verrucomicrobiota bacterium]
MKQFIVALLAVAVSLASSGNVIGQFPHAPPPPGDPYLTNRFGISWGAPISSGFLIAGGKYIDAPYVVEQRGYVIFVNNARVEDGCDVRLVLPEPARPIVTEDPGFPTNLTRETPLGTALMNPVSLAKESYWSYKGIYGEERVKKSIDFYGAFPCVAKVENRGALIGEDIGLRLTDHSGKKVGTIVPMKPIPPRDLPPPDKDLLKTILQTKSLVEQQIGGAVVFAHAGGVVTVESYNPDDADRWKAIFTVLKSEEPPAVKLERVKKLGLVNPARSIESVDGVVPLVGFQASDQVFKRLSNDNTWKAEAEDMIRKLTNSWPILPPPWERVATVKPVAPSPPVTPVVAVTPTTITPDVAANPVKTPAPEKKSPQEPEPQGSPRVLLYLVAGCAVLVVVVLLMRRK